MKTLCLDIATRTGWAILIPGGPRLSGMLVLASESELAQQRASGQERALDIRFVRLYGFIRDHLADGVTRIVFEDVLFAKTQAQSQLWASLRAAVWAASLARNDTSLHSVPVATLKQFASGNGLATKGEMAEALQKTEPGLFVGRGEDACLVKADGTVADDNEIDAIWLSLYTASVDRGERAFLGPSQRQKAARASRRAALAERRAAAKAKRAARQAEVDAKAAWVWEFIRSLGPCCGILRRHHKRRAFCPRCGSNVVIPRFAQQGDGH